MVSVLDQESAGAVGVDADVDETGVAREERVHPFWPLYQAEGAGVEVVGGTDVLGLPGLLQTVEVKVVYKLGSLLGAVLVDDGERRRTDRLLHTQLPAELGDEGGLAGPHRTAEGDDGAVVEHGQEFPCGLRQGLQRWYLNLFHTFLFAKLLKIHNFVVRTARKRPQEHPARASAKELKVMKRYHLILLLVATLLPSAASAKAFNTLNPGVYVVRAGGKTVKVRI